MKQYSKSFAIGIVLFNPTLNQLNRIDDLKNSKYQIYILDNAPSLQTSRLNDNTNFTYIPSKSNLGLGAGISLLCQSAYEDNFPNLIFFDQDTIFTNNTLDFIWEFISYNNIIIHDYSVVCFKSIKNNIINNNKFSIIAAEFVINSGSLFILDNLFKMKWHNSSYFVDGVDYEFCIRSHFNGFKIGLNINTPDYDHISDQPDIHVNLFGKVLLIRKYNSARIKDTLASYARLLGYTISSGSFRYTYVLTRSFFIYILGLTLSTFLIK